MERVSTEVFSSLRESITAVSTLIGVVQSSSDDKYQALSQRVTDLGDMMPILTKQSVDSTSRDMSRLSDRIERIGKDGLVSMRANTQEMRSLIGGGSE